MGKLAKRKSRLIVEFSDSIRERRMDREIIMEISPYLIRVRLKGMRQAYEISPARIYNHAALCAAEAARSAKGKTRRPR